MPNPARRATTPQTARIVLFTTLIILLFTAAGRAQLSAVRFTHVTHHTKGQPADKLEKVERAPLALAGAPPTIGDFNPKTGRAGQMISIAGTNFDETARVTFGGTAAASISVISNTQIQAIVGLGASGDVVVTTDEGAAPPKPGFVLAQQPSISAVSHTTSSGSTILLITGTNFAGWAKVSVNGDDAVEGTILSSTSVYISFPYTFSLTSLTVSTPGGDATYPTAAAATGSANLNIPAVGSGLTIIPTASFDYTQQIKVNKFGFTGRVWGNSLGTDSTRQKLGAKFLSPETSEFAVKLEGDWRMSKPTATVPFTASLECNFLWKEVAFFDTVLKVNTNFNPFVIHTRLGLIASFAQDNWFVAAYANIPAIVGSNAQFSTFFKESSRNVFFYPEFDIGGLIPVSNGGSQALKFQLNVIVNNGDAQVMSGTTDILIPYFSFGFVSTF